jgi:signal transduction histidine kinase
MKWFKRLKIKQKIWVSTVWVVLFIATVSWLSIQFVVLPNLSNEITNRGGIIAKSIARRAQQYLTADDRPNLLDVIFTEKWMEPYLAYVFIISEVEGVISHTLLQPFPASLLELNPLPPDRIQHTRLVKTSFGSVYDTAMAIYEESHRIGTVRVGLSKVLVDETMGRLINILLVLLALIISIALVLTNWFSRQITEPILQLSDLTRDLISCNFQACAHLGKRVECWLLKECEQEDCPAHSRGRPPCWLIDDAPSHGTVVIPHPNKLEECSRCEVNKAMVGDEIEQLAAAFSHMIHKLDLYQEELKLANEDLRRLNRNYMEMLRFVSHELKTPIANSSMTAQALLQRIFGDLTPPQEKMVHLICENLTRSVEMVKHYLDLSRIETGELLFQPRRLHLYSEVVEPVLAEFAILIDISGMRVEDQVDDEVILEADEELLRVVYTNLIGNACKYGREGGLIRLRAKDLGSTYRLEVWNDGPGVPQDKIEQLFQKFTRIQGPRKDGIKGTGLGLFISRKIVEWHRGKIWVEGCEERWINFIMELPKSQKGSRANEPKEDTDHRRRSQFSRDLFSDPDRIRLSGGHC